MPGSSIRTRTMKKSEVSLQTQHASYLRNEWAFTVQHNRGLTYQWPHRNPGLYDYHHNKHICSKVDHKCLCTISYHHTASESCTQVRSVERKYIIIICEVIQARKPCNYCIQNSDDFGENYLIRRSRKVHH